MLKLPYTDGWGRKKKLPIWFSRGEVLALFAVIDDDLDRFSFKMLYYHGLRLAELYSMKREDVRIEERLVVVRGGKGGQDRTVPLAEPMRAWLERVLVKKGAFLIPVHTLSLRSWEREMQRKIKNYAHKAGARNWYQYTPHKLRHSYASHVYQRTGDIKTVQELLGHKHLSTTEVYTHITSEQKTRAVERTFEK